MHRSVAVEVVSPDSAAQLDEFFVYFREHVAENGAPGIGYFQPMPRGSSDFSAQREERFRNALAIEVTKLGWRRLWLARSSNGSIAGHIDLRGHTEHYASHRCLLGIGVHSANRKSGVGSLLLENATHWAHSVAGLEWIDLQVLSVNEAAKKLYHRFGFVTVGEIPEMFRIDDQNFSYTYMALHLGGDA
jgi:ribosomal protein S18 acetylase RimI-like enzyme